jgi:hypothetical protein
MSVAGQGFGILLPVERFQNHSAKPLRFIHKRKIPFQDPRSPDQESQNDGFSSPNAKAKGRFLQGDWWADGQCLLSRPVGSLIFCRR